MYSKFYLLKATPLVFFAGLWLTTSYFLQKPCIGLEEEIGCLYDSKIGLLQPLYFASLWLAGIFFGMAFVPWHIYKKWLLTILPITLLVTLWLVSNISPKSGFLLNPSRAQMTVNCMVVLVALSGLFVGGHLLHDMRKAKQQKKLI